MTSNLPQEAWNNLEDMGSADLVVGIPSYNASSTIGHLVEQVAFGLDEYFPKHSSVVLVCDGGSTDGTLKSVKAAKTPTQVKVIATRYQGISGKGTAIRAVFEASRFLGSEGTAMVDSDLRSLTSEWIRLLLSPILKKDTDLVTPLYSRHKYDGTITNFICYPLTRSLYGKKVRQPIGGDFALSRMLVKRLLESPIWKSGYPSRFGIDIFITHTALGEGLAVKQAFLGTKIHEAKDPARQLASMFHQVVGSLFSCMQLYEDKWRGISGSENLEIVRDGITAEEPEAIQVNLASLEELYRTSLQTNLPTYRNILGEKILTQLKHYQRDEKNLISDTIWTKASYIFSSFFKRAREEKEKKNLLEAFRGLWIGRIASFVRETIQLSSEEAEAKVEKQAELFEELKPTS